jgi:phosphonate transport system ATP-binding protein
MQRPELLVADEPAASLDPQAGREVMAIFSQLAQRRRLTLIFVSHHLEHALRFSDRIVGLREGVLALDRPASDCHSEGLEGIYG